MKRVILIWPSQFYSEEVGSAEPIRLNLVALKDYLRGTAEVDVIDLEMEYGRPTNAEEKASFLTAVGRRLTACAEYDVVGISSFTSFAYSACMAVGAIARDRWPHSCIVVGGYHATARPKDFCLDHTPFDFVVVGEGEAALRRIVEVAPERPLRPQVVTGTSLPSVEWPVLNLDDYGYRCDSITVPLSRGCPMSCNFCVQSEKSRSPWRTMRAEDALGLVDRLYGEYCFREFKFADAYFGLQPAWMREFLSGLHERAYSTQYWAECRTDTLDDTILDAIAELPFTLYFGVESLSPSTLLAMNKTRRPQEYIESVKATVRQCCERDIPLELGFIMNHPGETRDSFRETLANLAEMIDENNPICFTAHAFAFKLYPGNEVYSNFGAYQRQYGTWCADREWWLRDEPRIRRYAERLMGSQDLVDEFGYAPLFWLGEWSEVLAEIPRKLSDRVYGIKNAVKIARISSAVRKTRSVEHGLLSRFLRKTDQTFLGQWAVTGRMNPRDPKMARIRGELKQRKQELVEEMLHLLFNDEVGEDELPRALDALSENYCEDMTSLTAVAVAPPSQALNAEKGEQ